METLVTPNNPKCFCCFESNSMTNRADEVIFSRNRVGTNMNLPPTCNLLPRAQTVLMNLGQERRTKAANRSSLHFSLTTLLFRVQLGEKSCSRGGIQQKSGGNQHEYPLQPAPGKSETIPTNSRSHFVLTCVKLQKP